MNKYKILFIHFLLSLSITLIWQIYEIEVFGEVKQDMFDMVIIVIMSLSLTFNIVLIKKIKKGKMAS